MLQPKKMKYRKQFRTGAKTIASRGISLAFGDYGLKAEQGGWLSEKQIEAARRAVSHFTRRGGKIWIRVFPDKPITQKAAGTRMGKGKGDVKGYVAVVTPGRILFEITGVTREVAQEAFLRAAHKLPIKTRFVIKG